MNARLVSGILEFGGLLNPPFIEAGCYGIGHCGHHAFGGLLNPPFIEAAGCGARLSGLALFGGLLNPPFIEAEQRATLSYPERLGSGGY